jgi:hypothetical protein
LFIGALSLSKVYPLLKPDIKKGVFGANKLNGSHSSKFSLIKTKDGNYIMAGSGSSRAAGGSGCLIETDSKCNFLWRQTYENVAPTAMIQTSDGGYAIGGSLPFKF